MTAVSRNALCPCGSGKKYKHCCGKGEAVSIDSLIERELVECMHDVLLFASERYEDEIVEVIAERSLEDRPEALDLAVNLFVANWVIFCRPIEEKGTTIFSAYMRDRRYARWRPAVQAHVARWEGTVPSFDEIIHFDEHRRHLLVRDILTGKEKHVYLLATEEWPEMEKGDVLLGCLVPYKEEFTYFSTVFPVVKRSKERLVQALQAAQERSGKTGDEFLRNSFPLALDAAISEFLWQLLDEAEWDDPEEEAVILELKRHEADASALLLSQATIFWRMYCAREAIDIDNPAVYAAALRFFAGQMIEEDRISEGEAARRYGVSVEDVESTAMEFLLFGLETLDEEDDGDEEWSNDGGWDDDADWLDVAIDEWLDKVEQLLHCHGWDTDKVNRLIDEAINKWKKDGLLQGVNEEKLREELENCVYEMFVERGFF
ncbi:preprotein translocase subunit SecA [Geobacillus sp. 46C-IIa]|nr:preprotein translocase subunit SecA [Geobacillus sp. 46C-IIa]QNU29597.1 SEC-C domain-containing protein [Geobacillus sp. 46C-IIa]